MCGTGKHCAACNNIGESPFLGKKDLKMSRYDYEQGKKIEMCQYPFYGLLQATMRQSDTDNLEKLKTAFPEVWKELQDRYKAPGGFLDSDFPNKISS